MAQVLNTNKGLAVRYPDRYLIVILILSLIIFQGCASRARLGAVPDALDARAHVPGLDSGIRYFPRDPEHVQFFMEDYLKPLVVEKPSLPPQAPTEPLPPMAML